jgi:predicted GIY-YIG superfamily endonuclease
MASGPFAFQMLVPSCAAARRMEACLSGFPSSCYAPTMSAWFYILRLQSGALYPGATTDLARRWQEHANGTAGRTTRIDPPAALVYREPLATFSDARRREAQVKRWTRAKKEALVAGDTQRLRELAASREEAPPAARRTPPPSCG